MGILQTLGRIPKMLEANINDLLDKCEDPGKMAEQMLVDYKREVINVKREVANVMADYEMADKKVKEYEAKVKKQEDAARNALLAGDEEAARRILEQKKQIEQMLVQLTENRDSIQKDMIELRAAYDKLVADVSILEAKRDSIKAKASRAKAKKAQSSARSYARASSIGETFDKYQNKVDKELAKAEAMSKLDNMTTTDELVDKYSNGSSEVNAELAAMKASLGL